MSGGLRRVFRRLLSGFSGPEPPSAERLNKLRSQLTSEQEIRRLIAEQRQIQAIKAVRAETGASLLEAKTAVDEVAREMEEGSSPTP